MQDGRLLGNSVKGIFFIQGEKQLQFTITEKKIKI